MSAPTHNYSRLMAHAMRGKRTPWLERHPLAALISTKETEEEEETKARAAPNCPACGIENEAAAAGIPLGVLYA